MTRKEQRSQEPAEAPLEHRWGRRQGLGWEQDRRDFVHTALAHCRHMVLVVGEQVEGMEVGLGEEVMVVDGCCPVGWDRFAEGRYVEDRFGYLCRRSTRVDLLSIRLRLGHLCCRSNQVDLLSNRLVVPVHASLVGLGRRRLQLGEVLIRYECLLDH